MVSSAPPKAWVESLSALLLELYRLPLFAGPVDFRQRTFELLRGTLDFDSGVWGTGVMTPDGPIVHSVYAHDQPKEMMESFEKVKGGDAVGLDAFLHLGKTINATPEAPDYAKRLGPAALEHTRRFGMAHILATTMAVPVLSVFDSVALYRADPKHPFDEDERLFKQAVMPHLAETWSASQLAFVADTQGQRGARIALSDRRGLLRAAAPGVAELLRLEWPNYQGPFIPQEILSGLTSGRARRYGGTRVTVSSELVSDLFVLHFRPSRLTDKLTTREEEVAGLFGEGKSYKEIAIALQVSPTTVRNHLQRIYEKLGVTSKVELALLLSEAGSQARRTAPGTITSPPGHR